MRLSRLHIAGFKSFPDRAELGFDDGVTAIVGPNGCGKSNVVDAITWVLGEQSAKSLRGERMEDVIFNGSDARKPTATAEVRLRLTNVASPARPAAPPPEETPEELPIITRDVEIGRRLYRSGESEYLIDGEICRLRDVHDLLMDSGLGVKAYAVIEQGKIGQILSSRPAERRMLIEEAAGVTKYKSRRRAAELKLEAAEQNLTRVDDIIFEVEKQRGALKRQAARARRYRKLREELRTWEQVQFAGRHEALSRDVQAAEARLSDAVARDAAAAARVAELEAALQAVRLQLSEAESAATARREQAHARQMEMGRRQQQMQFDRQQIDELTSRAASFGAELQDLEGRREPAGRALAEQQDALAAATAARDDARQHVADRETDYGRAQAAVQAVEQEADRTRAAVLASSATLSALRQARDSAANARDRVAAEYERLDVEARELAAEAARADRARQDALQQLTALRAEHDRALAERREAEGRREALKQAQIDAAAARATCERELAGSEARLRSLEQLEASRATFGDAARFLLAEPGNRLRHVGALADHLAVEPRYARAVDALLGDRLQYVLVSTHDDVAHGLAALAERNAGRCGFVVIEAASTPESAAPFTAPDGATTLAAVARATGPHAGAVAQLVGRALIVDAFEQAQAMAGTVDVPVATLAGDVFHGPAVVEGGARRDARGILEARAEVTKVRDAVEAASRELAALSAAFEAAAAAVAEAEAAVAARVADHHEREKAIVALDAEVRRAGDDHARVSRRLDVVGTERARAAEAQAAAEQRRDEASTAIEAHESQQREAEANLGGVFERLQQAREAAESRLRLVTEVRTNHAALVERASALALDVARLEDAGRELESRIAGRRAELTQTDARTADLRASIVETERLLGEDVTALASLQDGLRDLDDRVNGLRADFGTREHAIRGARQQHEAVRAEVTQLEVSRARATADLAHLEEACLESIGIPLAEVVQIVAQWSEAGTLVPPAVRAPAGADEDDTDADAAAGLAADAPAAVESAEATGVADAADGDSPAEPAGAEANAEAIIALLKTRIERLGPVNMMAIEQFDELESRHTFLTGQRTDLLESIAQTGEAIRKIDTTTRERFGEAFETIKLNFEQTFTTLFGGGRAGLVLIDQENEVESGIDIIAQPPGKRLQNVQLLSGGEKALTAMALMFAIFKYRPSPFCLLDEIDAPLDDANIGRFVEMLQGMQAHTQFILITHNRKTMEIANRLYGVTMEEPGVSRLISVQMN